VSIFQISNLYYGDSIRNIHLYLPRSTRAGPAKSRGGGAVNDKQLSGSCKTACRFLVLLEPLSCLAERAAFFLP